MTTSMQDTISQYYPQSESRLMLHDLVERVEDGEYIVGRIETGEFVALPEVGKKVIDLFRKNYSLQEASDYLSQKYEMDFDLDSFVESLIDLGFVKSIDGHYVQSHPEENIAWSWLQPRHVQWLFSKPIKLLYATLLAIVIFSIITHPGAMPKYNAFFWSASGSLVVFVNTALFMTNLMVHELFHLMAARSLGVPAYINLGTRLHELVVQTNVTGLWALPRRKRYRVYLAGIAWDIVPVSVAILLLTYVELPTVTRNILSSLILLIFFGIVWQFQFYMRTDIYFVILDLLHCYNLFDDSVAYLQYLFTHIKHRLFLSSRDIPVYPLAHLSITDQRKVVAYTILMVFGSLVALVVFITYGIPILFTLFVEAFLSVKQGFNSGNPLLVIDGAVVILIEGTFQVLFVTTFIKNRKAWFSDQWNQIKLFLGR